MSFFIKSKPAGRNNHKNTFSDRSRKRKAPSTKTKSEDVTSSEDEGLGSNDTVRDSNSSEDENETAQEKKLRLAKVYIQEIEKAEKRKLENQELDDACKGDVIQQRLKEDYLKQAGKLRLKVASKYTGIDSQNIVVLKCKEQYKCCTTVCISNDNKFVFSGGKDGSLIKCVDKNNPLVQCNLPQFLIDKPNLYVKIVHTGSLEKKAKVISLPFIKKESSVIRGHSKSILSMAISHDFKFLAVGDESSDIQIWNPDNFKHLHTLRGHTKAITGLVFRKDTRTLYSASKDRSVKVWSVDDMSYIESLYGHMDGITCIDALSRERVITSGGRDSSIRIWKIVEETHLIYNGHTGSIDCIRLINEENFLSGGDDGLLSIWGVNKKKPLCIIKEAHGVDNLSGQPNWIVSVTTLVNTDLIASGSSNGKVILWKLGDSCRTITKLFEADVKGFINSMEFTGDGKLLIVAVGTEHKYGRWNVIKSAKNSVVIIPLIKSC